MTAKDRTLDPINLKQKRQDAALAYPAVWKNIIAEWNAGETGNSAWLTYAANYLLYTGGVRWAIDPFSMSTRIPGISSPNYLRDLQKLELVALTHTHNDHLDLNLIRSLSSLPIQWVIPDFMQELILEKTHIKKTQIITPNPGEKIKYRELTLTPFDSLHFHKHGGVKETGYLAAFEDQSWLFPGDIRNFDAASLPTFGNLNGVFAHLWLGKAQALNPHALYVEDFCDFFLSFQPKKIVVSHLNEYGRDETELWHEWHFEMVKMRFAEIAPQISVEMALMGSMFGLQ